MPRAMPCPHCAGSLNVPDNHAGNVKCPLCSKTFHPMPVATPIPAPEESEDSEDDDKEEAKLLRRVNWLAKIFMCLGFLGLALAMGMTASVDGMYNIGLLNVRQNLVIASGFFLVIGTMYELFGMSRKS